MTDFVEFDPPAAYRLTHDRLPATSWFALSTKSVDDFIDAGYATGSTNPPRSLALGINEITGKGYARQSQSTPAGSGESTTYSQLTWDTGTATDWGSPKTLVLCTTANNKGRALCAWNLTPGGAATDLSSAHASVQITPVVAPPSSGGSGVSWKVIEKVAGVHDASDGDLVLFTGAWTNPGAVDGTEMLIGTGFTSALVGAPVDDSWWDGYIPLGTTVLSVESATSLTMSAPATSSDPSDQVTFGLIVNLPEPTVGRRVCVFRLAPTYGPASLGDQGGPLEIVATSGTVLGGASTTLPAQYTALALEADGANWATLWEVASNPITPAQQDPSRLLPISQGNPPNPSDLSAWARRGGRLALVYNPFAAEWELVDSANVTLAFHSSTISDYITEPPTISLKAFPLQRDESYVPMSHSYVDVVPADGHMGINLSWDPAAGPASSSGAEILVVLKYGVMKLDGSQWYTVETSFTIADTDQIPVGSPADPASNYNLGLPLLDWTTPTSQNGSDLSGDNTNQWIHTTAGGIFAFWCNVRAAVNTPRP